MVDFVERVPSVVTAGGASPWLPYLHAAYGGNPAFPYDLRQLRLLKLPRARGGLDTHPNASLPTPRCLPKRQPLPPSTLLGRTSGFVLEEWPANLPRCSSCAGWLDDAPLPHAAPVQGLELYSATAGELTSLRWWFSGDTMRAPDHSWVEVARWQYPRESDTGVGTWFAPAPGSDVWINTGRSVRISHKRTGADSVHSGLALAWAASRNLSAVNARIARDLISPELGWNPWSHYNFHADIFTVMAYELGFDTVQIEVGTDVPEIVVVSAVSMLRADCCEAGSCTPLESLRRCEPPPSFRSACGHRIAVRTARLARECVCPHSEVLEDCNA